MPARLLIGILLIVAVSLGVFFIVMLPPMKELGLMALYLGITALVLLFLIASWAIATGIMQIIGAIRLRKEIDDEWMLIAGGALSVLFGIILVVQPKVGALALVWVIGAYAILYGILLCGFAWRIHRHSSVKPA